MCRLHAEIVGKQHVAQQPGDQYQTGGGGGGGGVRRSSIRSSVRRSSSRQAGARDAPRSPQSVALKGTHAQLTAQGRERYSASVDDSIDGPPWQARQSLTSSAMLSSIDDTRVSSMIKPGGPLAGAIADAPVQKSLGSHDKIVVSIGRLEMGRSLFNDHQVQQMFVLFEFLPKFHADDAQQTVRYACASLSFCFFNVPQAANGCKFLHKTSMMFFFVAGYTRRGMLLTLASHEYSPSVTKTLGGSLPRRCAARAKKTRPCPSALCLMMLGRI